MSITSYWPQTAVYIIMKYKYYCFNCEIVSQNYDFTSQSVSVVFILYQNYILKIFFTLRIYWQPIFYFILVTCFPKSYSKKSEYEIIWTVQYVIFFVCWNVNHILYMNVCKWKSTLNDQNGSFLRQVLCVLFCLPDCIIKGITNSNGLTVQQCTGTLTTHLQTHQANGCLMCGSWCFFNRPLI